MDLIHPKASSSKWSGRLFSADAGSWVGARFSACHVEKKMGLGFWVVCYFLQLVNGWLTTLSQPLGSFQILNHNVCVHIISDTVANYIEVLIEVMQSRILTDQNCLVCLYNYCCCENATWGTIMNKLKTNVHIVKLYTSFLFEKKVYDDLFFCVQAARKRKISILKAQGKSTEAIRELNEYLEQWVFLWKLLSPLPFILSLHLIHCVVRGYLKIGFDICPYRFVGDQEAWHELSDLYINEHE